MSRQASSQHLTATGIRIVGSAAAELVARASSHLEPPPSGDVLWAAGFRARPRIGSGSPVPAILHRLTEVLQREWDACPPLGRDQSVARPAARFHGISWDVMGEPGAWMGELVWRHRHPVLAGTPCTTHLIIEEQQQHTRVSLASAADGGQTGVRGVVAAGQARPLLLDELRQVVTLTFDHFDGAPIILTESEVAPFVREVLLSESREWPVAVQAPLEGDLFVVPPEEIANELFGLAPLYVLERQPCTFRLTDAIGDRRLSAYFGALRVYREEFSCADRSDDHWLLLRDRLDDPLERAALVGRVARVVANRHLPMQGVRARCDALARMNAPTPVTMPTPTVEQSDDEATPPPSSDAVPSPPIGAGLPAAVVNALGELPAAMGVLAAQLRDLSGTIAHLVAANVQLSDEVARLRTTTAIRATSTNAMERRLAAMESVLVPAAESEEIDAEAERDDDIEDLEDQPTLVDAVRHAASEYGDALLILDSAEKTAAESPYADVDRVAAVLQAMAYVARRRQEGGLDTGMRAAFQELGVDYRAGIAKSTSERLRHQYEFRDSNGLVHLCAEHIALGSTYDPRRCLRIYFTSRAASEVRFVIGHVGRHLTVMTST